MKRKWYNIHFWLIILNLIAVIFILQIVFNVIPLWKCDMSPEKIERINSFVVDLSLGIITSTFFYYLLVYIGERKRGKDIRKLILWRLNLIALNMQIIFAYYIAKYHICSDYKCLEIDSKAFNCVESPSLEEIRFWFRDEHSETSMNVCGSTERGFLCNYTDLVVHHANQIKESSLFALEDTEMIQLIDEITRCLFVSDMTMLAHNPKLQMGFGDFGKAVCRFHTLYKHLSKYVQLKGLVVMEENPRLGIPFIYK